MSTRTSAIKWGDETAPSNAGMTGAGVRKILDVYQSQLTEGLHFGAQLVVLRHGQVVLDRADGMANVKRKLPVTPITPFHVFSASKPFTAACALKLVEQGRIGLDSPVAEYWPEFGTKGKENTTIRHALLHQAGIPVRGLYGQIFSWSNWDRVTRNVANLQAEFPPGSKTAYHLVNTGFILGEVIRRVTGQPIELFLQENFLEPLGLRNTCLGLPVKKQKEASYIYAGDRTQSGAAFIFNQPSIRSAVIPSATINSTARDLAVFFQMLLEQGTYAGKKLLKPATVNEAVSVGYDGIDETFHIHMHWGLGFDLGGGIKPKDAPIQLNYGYKNSLSTFGHCGQGGSALVWADSDKRVVVSFLTNRLYSDEITKPRWQAISDAVWDALA